jgi:hypothetical protein
MVGFAVALPTLRTNAITHEPECKAYLATRTGVQGVPCNTPVWEREIVRYLHLSELPSCLDIFSISLRKNAFL